MPRVKRGVTARARHKKVLDQAKGYRGRRSKVYRIAKEALAERPDFRLLTLNRSEGECADAQLAFLQGVEAGPTHQICMTNSRY